MGKKSGITKFLLFILAAGLVISGPVSGGVTAVAAKSTGEISQNIPDKVLVCGFPIGMRLETTGLLVTGYKAFLSESEEYVSPAKNAEIMIGDKILEIDGIKVSTGDEMQSALSRCRGGECLVLTERGNETIERRVKPERDFETGEFRIGVWVKERSAGIGTLTFYDDDSGFFGALGHGISDNSTHCLFPAEGGDIYSAVITGVNKGLAGSPGELRGYFREDIGGIGHISANTDNGVYGYLYPEGENLFQGTEMNVDKDRSVHKGDAYIITTVDDNGPCRFSVSIDNVDVAQQGNKGISLHITDEKLLSVTGGIVQGLSGSPIIQDDELIGAVTHVLINDPSRGYGIFVENMFDAA
ncbi:MAG: SpoIVB peptidase [Clostridia bacterium]|nr:SpoIVB peptidase [Clostridia bacterium]